MHCLLSVMLCALGGNHWTQSLRDAAHPVITEQLLTDPSWTAESDQQGGTFGYQVASAGDVNADGFSDVIVAAVGYDDGEVDEGKVVVYLGSSGGLSLTADWSVTSNQAGAFFGASVACAGDVNGDGYSDVIVGATNYDHGEPDEGRAFLYVGSAKGLSLDAVWTAEGNQAGAFFGSSVSSAGDVNRDGFRPVRMGGGAQPGR